MVSGVDRDRAARGAGGITGTARARPIRRRSTSAGLPFIALSPVSRRKRAAFSLVELLVVILIIAILLGILLPVISRARRTAKTVNCLSNVRQIAIAFVNYAGDHGGRLPDPTGDDISWEDALEKYVRTKDAYRCPADSELFDDVGSSYDWRDTGNPETTLAGRPITDGKKGQVVLVFDSLPGWHVKKTMNAAFVDASAVTMDEQECLQNLTKPLRPPEPKKDDKKGGGK